jgi:hypothetical protein
MVVPLATILLALAGPAAAGPDAETISRIDHDDAMATCQRFYHAVPCPTGRAIIADLGCATEADGVARCHYTMRWRKQGPKQSCTAGFSNLGGSWYHVPRPGPLSDPAMPQPDRFEAPVCSDVGAPDGAQLLAARTEAGMLFACLVHSEAKQPCPAASGRIEELRCRLRRDRRIAHCDYRVHARGEFFCQAALRRQGKKWSFQAHRAVDGRVSFDENCSGPVVRAAG